MPQIYSSPAASRLLDQFRGKAFILPHNGNPHMWSTVWRLQCTRKTRLEAEVHAVAGGDIAILRTPSEFFERLKVHYAAIPQKKIYQRLDALDVRPIAENFGNMQDGIRGARQDITMASLYSGTAGGREADFMRYLSTAARERPATRPNITMLLDALRSTRPSKDEAGALPGSSHSVSQASFCVKQRQIST